MDVSSERKSSKISLPSFFTFFIVLNCVLIPVIVILQNSLQTSNQTEEALPKTWPTTKSTMTKKYIQYSCSKGGCSGLADRFKAIFSTYALAQLTDRSFLIDMQWPCPLERLLEPNKVNWSRQENSSLNKTVRKIDYYKKDYDQLKSEDMIEFSEAKSSELLIINSQIMYMNAFADNPHLEERIRGLGYTPAKFKLQFMFHDWFKKLFKLNKDLELEFQTMKKLVGKDRPGHKLICAQFREGIRTQTHMSEDGTFIRVNASSELFWRFINSTFVSKLNESNYTIYVTTDSNQVKQEAKDFFGAEKLFTTSGKSNFHIDEDFREHRERQLSESEQADVCRDVSKVLLDFLLLGECDMGVVSHSGFGILGMWNRPDPGKDFYIYSNLDYVRRGVFSPHNKQFIYLHELDQFHFYLKE